MLTRLMRLALGPAAHAGRQILDADARLALPPRALGGPAQALPYRDAQKNLSPPSRAALQSDPVVVAFPNNRVPRRP